MCAYTFRHQYQDRSGKLGCRHPSQCDAGAGPAVARDHAFDMDVVVSSGWAVYEAVAAFTVS